MNKNIAGIIAVLLILIGLFFLRGFLNTSEAPAFERYSEEACLAGCFYALNTTELNESNYQPFDSCSEKCIINAKNITERIGGLLIYEAENLKN